MMDEISRPNLWEMIPHQNTKTIVNEHWPSEAWFPSCDLLTIKGNAHSADLDFPCTRLRRETSGTHPAFFHHPSVGLLQDVDLQIILVLHHIFFLQFGSS
jgi:hypothetical protein